MVGQKKNLRGGGGKHILNIIYNKVNNNSENYREARLLPGRLSPPSPP